MRTAVDVGATSGTGSPSAYAASATPATRNAYAWVKSDAPTTGSVVPNPGVARVITSVRTAGSVTSCSHEYQSSPSVVVDARRYGTTAATAVKVSATVTTGSLARPVAARARLRR